MPALAYGLGGLVPFVTIPAHMVNAGVFIPELAYCHLAYGAIILSFLGGTRWGLTLPHPQVSFRCGKTLQPPCFRLINNLGFSWSL